MATGGGIFSVALSSGSPPPGITRHPALGSPDFPPVPRSRRRWGTGGRLASSNLLEMSVDRAVRQPIGILVFPAPYVQYTRPRESAQTMARLAIQRAQEIRCDPVFAVELSNEQFRVGQDRQGGRGEFLGLGKSQQEGSVLGHVVGGIPDVLGTFDPALPSLDLQHHAEPGRERDAPADRA